MKSKILIITITLLLITIKSVLSENFFTRIRNQEFIGARPLSMGETFVAVADDINAIYWNPAGLPALNHLGLNSMHTNLFNSGIGCNYLALSIPGLPKTSIGVDWMSISFGDNELDYGKNKFNFSGGYQLFNWLSLGFSVKYIKMSASLDQISQGSFYGWGSDLGMLCKINRKLKLGLVIHDFTNTTLQGIKGPLYKQNLRVGAAYQLYDNLLIATDVDDRFHIGSEYLLFKKLLALRAGLQHDFYTDENTTFSFGMGLDIPLWGQRLRFDYAFTNTPMLPNTHRTSLSFLIDLFPRLVKINRVEIEPVYASLYKYHSKNPIGKVYVDYKGEKELDCTISVTVNKYSNEQKKNIIITPKSVAENIQQLSINTVFNDSILYEPDNIPLIADIKISYMSGNKIKEEQHSEQFYLFSRNSIDWGAGAEQAAAFITPNDPVVKQFVRMALSREKNIEETRIKSEQFIKAVRLFNAVSKFGIRYEEDSYSPYSKTYQAFDNIYYPAQLLREKQGDCDDLVVLIASLFENKNIATALVSVPGHIFLLFNSAVHPSRPYQLCCSDDRYCVYQNQLWIPLETTWLDSSFIKAWDKGAEIFNQYSEDYKQIINVREAWAKYEPLAYTGKLVRPFLTLPQHDFAQEKQNIIRNSEQYLSELEIKAAQFPDNTQLRNLLAITYVFQDKLEQAETHFQYLLKNDSTNFLTLNNLGNIFFMKENLDSAEIFYLKALEYAKDEDVDGINLNLGLLYYAANLDSMAIDLFASVMQDSADYHRIGDLLGINIQEADLVKSAKLEAKNLISTTTVKKLISKANEKKKTRKKIKRKKIKKKKVFGAKGQYANDKKKTNKPLGAKGCHLLYWAD